MGRRKEEIDQVVFDSIVATLTQAGTVGVKRADLLLRSGMKDVGFFTVMNRLLESGTVVRYGAKRGSTWYLTKFAPSLPTTPSLVNTMEPVVEVVPF